MKNTIITFLTTCVVLVSGNAQPIPDTYETTHHLQMVVDVKVEVFEDSLIHEKCQMFADEAFLGKINRSDTARFYYLEDASVVAVESHSYRSRDKITEIYDTNQGIRLKLTDPKEKYGLKLPYEDKPATPKHDFTWKANGEKETIEGVTTEIYEGTAQSYRGPIEATVWLADSKLVPASLMRKLPPVQGLEGIPMQYVEKESDKCSQMTVTMQLQGITKKDRVFDLTEWAFEGSGSQSQYYEEEEYMEEYEEGEEVEEYMEEAEKMVAVSTWSEELMKFDLVRAEMPDAKPTTEKIAGDSIRYTTPFPKDGQTQATITLTIPDSWQIENGFLKNGWPEIWLSSMPVDDLERKSMKDYDIWNKEQMVITISKVEPHNELNNVDGHYDDSSEAWGDDGPLYEFAMRRYENDNGNKLKMIRCLIKRVDERDDYYFDDYLIEGFVHHSENEGLVEKFVLSFIKQNDL